MRARETTKQKDHIAPKKLDRKSNFLGVIIMKLTYELRKQGISYSKLSVMLDIQKLNSGSLRFSRNEKNLI